MEASTGLSSYRRFVLGSDTSDPGGSGRSMIEIGSGDAFEVGPGHDAWVMGDETCVALDVSFKGLD